MVFCPTTTTCRLGWCSNPYSFFLFPLSLSLTNTPSFLAVKGCSHDKKLLALHSFDFLSRILCHHNCHHSNCTHTSSNSLNFFFLFTLFFRYGHRGKQSIFSYFCLVFITLFYLSFSTSLLFFFLHHCLAALCPLPSSSPFSFPSSFPPLLLSHSHRYPSPLLQHHR